MQCKFVLPDRDLLVFYSCSEVSAYINQEFVLWRAKQLHFMPKLSDFVLWHHILAMEQVRNLRAQFQDIQEEKRTILALVATKSMESNVYMVQVSIDWLSHTVIFFVFWHKKLDGFSIVDLEQSVAHCQPGQQDCLIMIPCCIFEQIMFQHLRICVWVGSSAAFTMLSNDCKAGFSWAMSSEMCYKKKDQANITFNINSA